MKNGLTARLRQHAADNGIDLLGITTPKSFVRNGAIVDPKELLDDAAAVVVAGFYMKETEDLVVPKSGTCTGRFSAAYNIRAFTAMDKHYNKTIQRFFKDEGYRAVANKNYRIPDKQAAVRAGLGTYGKSSVVITKPYGSCVMFVTLVTNAPLDQAEYPMEKTGCGACVACIRACPTGAITAPFKVDRKLCITSWLWGSFVPARLREKQEDRLFGCGECIRVCPKNKNLQPRRDYPVPLESVPDRPELIPLLDAGEAYYKRTIAAFPRRAGLETLRGNAIIALGNAREGSAAAPLGRILEQGTTQNRAYAAWALGRIGGAKAKGLLKKAATKEPEHRVLQEIEQALNGIQ